jgi:Rod binding domain-containing protein
MRKSSFAEKQGPYGEMAQDMFDQAIAEQTAQSGEGLGIAYRIFDSTAPRLVREAAARFLAEQAANPAKETPHAPTH